MPDQAAKMGVAETIYVLMRGFVVLAVLAAIMAALLGWPALAKGLGVGAVVLWLLRVFFVTPLLQIFARAANLKGAWRAVKDRRPL
jgi:hypothetical protein